MEMTVRPMQPQERLYCYSQSSQIAAQTACIGYLRADFGSNGTGFWSTWNDENKERKTGDFKAEFDDVINTLRDNQEYGGILKGRISMFNYCYAHPEAGLGDDRQFGFRADTEKYAYLLRVNPYPNNYNLYCYCYERRWLDRHLEQAAKGIRFIDPHYKELFRIPDGDMVRVVREDGTHFDKTCRYVDDCHLEIYGAGSELFHICQFAEIMERNGYTVIPLRSSLPDKCYCVLPGSEEIIIAKKGETGYYRTDKYGHDREDALNIVAELNESGGVTRAQAEAMLAGSMFGWGCPAADPKSYDEDGKPILPKHRDRGDAR